MRYALQGDDCWAGRDKLIKGNRQNTSVHNDTYKHLVPFSTSKTRDQLIVEFNETLKSLREAQQGNATISSSISTFNIHYDEEKIMRLLKMKIEKPELTEREHYLLELAQTGNTSYNKIVVFIDRSPAECYNSFRVLWIGEALLPQRRFLGGSNHSFFVEMLIS